MLTFKDLVRTARPLLWLNTSMLWVIGLLVLQRAPTWADLVMILYFLFPFNLWLHGINDVYDYESDRLNARKGGDEGALLHPAVHRPLLRRLIMWNLPILPLTLWQGTPLAMGLLLLFLFLGWSYSAPPIRGKSRPFIDSLINTGYIFPYLIVLAWHAAPLAVWRQSLPAILAFAAWSIASHAFTSIQDIEVDRAANVRTVATRLGYRGTALFSLLFYLTATVIVAGYGWPWALLIGLYPLLVLWHQLRPSTGRANRLYRLFILANSFVGFTVTVTLALASPPNTLWAATLVLVLVALVLGLVGWTGRQSAGLPVDREAEGDNLIHTP